jgi:nucleoside-diphosphate-sugar epimerase
VGPGVTTWSLAQFICWMIERPARGEPFTVWATPETTTPLVYVKDAGEAMVRLADAPADAIRTVNYVIDGVKPTPTAGEEAAAVRRRLPDADLRFEPDPAVQVLLDKGTNSIDDSPARSEWGWSPTYGLDAMVDDFVEELRRHPERYTDGAA